MKLRVTHLTRYHYDRVVGFAPHVIYLRPRESAALQLESYTLQVQPRSTLTIGRDAQDNNLIYAYIWDQGNVLEIRSEFIANTLESNPFDFILAPSAITFPFTYSSEETHTLHPYLTPPDNGTRSALRTWLETHFPRPPGETVPWLTGLAQCLFQHIRYQRREEEGLQSSLETICLGTGSCRDFAVLMIDLLRTLGLAARFVSGYLYAPAEDDHRSYGAMHAWIEVYLPGAGWKGIDPTHGIFCGDAFIPVAHAARPETVNPIQGSIATDEPAHAELSAEILVEPL